MVTKLGGNPKQYAPPSLIRNASALAARGDVSERVIQRERWKSDACKVYTRSNADDAGHVSRKLAAGKGLQRQPGQDTVWGNCINPILSSDVEE